MVDIIFGLFKIFLLAALVVLGVVFLPDGFMAQVEQKVGVAENYLQAEASRRAPGLAEEFNRKVVETKGDLDSLYRSTKEKYFPQVSDWVSGFFVPKAK